MDIEFVNDGGVPDEASVGLSAASPQPSASGLSASIPHARITPDNITALAPNEVFVFGSNTAGRHGKGAAKTALKWGALMGEGFGHWGRTWAIPTLIYPGFRKRSLAAIAKDVEIFTEAAKAGQFHFLVTEIGCGLAGFDHKEIAPIFLDCVSLANVSMPRKFWRILQHAPNNPTLTNT